MTVGPVYVVGVSEAGDPVVGACDGLPGMILGTRVLGATELGDRVTGVAPGDPGMTLGPVYVVGVSEVVGLTVTGEELGWPFATVGLNVVGIPVGLEFGNPVGPEVGDSVGTPV
jgi:hypothetical protein